MPAAGSVTSSYKIQFAILIGLAAVYLVLALLAAPRHAVTLVLLGPVSFGIAVGVARKLGQSATSGAEMILVFFAMVLIFMPMTLTPPISSFAGVAGGLGVVLVEGFWAIHRYPNSDKAVRLSFSGALLRGVVLSCGFLLLGLVLILLGAAIERATLDPYAALIEKMVLGYLIIAVLVGLLFASTRKVLRWPLGVMFVGVIGGLIVGAALSPGINELESLKGHHPLSSADLVFGVMAWALAVGPPAAVWMMWSDDLFWT